MSENQNIPSLPSIEQATAEFQAGVTAALRSWSALRTAVNNEWGGIMSRDKAEYLRSYILENLAYTLPNPKLDIDSLEDNLAIYMEEEFSIVLEDESEKQLAQLIWQLHQSCGKGDYSMSRQIVSDSMKSENINEKVAVQCDSDDDSDNEMVDTNTFIPQSNQDQYLFGIPQSVLDENRSNQTQTCRQPKPEPIVDDDGFTLVTKR
jgi:pre-rRNA-processing protein TSR2